MTYIDVLPQTSTPQGLKEITVNRNQNSRTGMSVCSTDWITVTSCHLAGTLRTKTSSIEAMPTTYLFRQEKKNISILEINLIYMILWVLNKWRQGVELFTAQANKLLHNLTLFIVQCLQTGMQYKSPSLGAVLRLVTVRRDNYKGSRKWRAPL